MTVDASPSSDALMIAIAALDRVADGLGYYVTLAIAGVAGASLTAYGPLSAWHPRLRVLELGLGLALLACAFGFVAFDVASGFLSWR